MNTVTVNAMDITLPDWSDSLRAFVTKTLDSINKNNWDLSVLLCSDRAIKELNTQYRNKAETTDVLSFRQDTEFSDEGGLRYLPGDIVISLDTLRENSKIYKISEDEELRRLLIHGILHLDGMDHVSNNDTEPMIVLQEEILKKLNGEHIL
ncbi:MAG: rRNA maturation RNase YbeY [Treponema sp.]|nr:rRNA maturation RNase YbeY [Treponema sp.]